MLGAVPMLHLSPFLIALRFSVTVLMDVLVAKPVCPVVGVWFAAQETHRIGHNNGLDARPVSGCGHGFPFSRPASGRALAGRSARPVWRGRGPALPSAAAPLTRATLGIVRSASVLMRP